MTRPTLTPALSGLLGGWLPRQRWFPVKSAEFSFEPAGGLSLAGLAVPAAQPVRPDWRCCCWP